VITMEVESEGIVIRKIGFVLENGERWIAHDPHAAIYQREDGGGWMVGWENGAVGPFETSQFAQAVAHAMRQEAAPT
jgi:hypothetical protein